MTAKKPTVVDEPGGEHGCPGCGKKFRIKVRLPYCTPCLFAMDDYMKGMRRA